MRAHALLVLLVFGRVAHDADVEDLAEREGGGLLVVRLAVPRKGVREGTRGHVVALGRGAEGAGPGTPEEEEV